MKVLIIIMVACKENN